MKALLPILLAACSTAAPAQQIYRCEGGLAPVAYRDTPCTASAGAPAPELVFATSEAASPSDSEIGRPSARRVRAQQEGQLIGLRVQARQKPSDDRKATQYADNHRRCTSALRIAELCGKHAGTFYCDARGFQPIPEAARVKPVVLDNGGRYEMERCALGAATAGP